MVKKYENKWLNVVFYLLLIAAGLVLIINPRIGVNFARFYLAIILVVSGIICIWQYFKSTTGSESRVLLFEGIAILILGLAFFISLNFSNFIFAIGLILWMLVVGIFEITRGIYALRSELPYWWFTTLIGVVSLIFAGYVLFNMKATVLAMAMIAGIFLVIQGLGSLIATLLFHKQSV